MQNSNSSYTSWNHQVVAFPPLHIINASRWRVPHQTIILSRPEFSLFVKLMSTLGHFLYFGKSEIFLVHEVVDGFGIFGGDVVDLS